MRFIVGIKIIMDTLRYDKARVIQFVIPVLFGIVWAVVLYLARKKNGDYGAPPGMLYM